MFVLFPYCVVWPTIKTVVNGACSPKRLTLDLNNSHGNVSAVLPVLVRCGARQTAHGKSVWETSDKKHQSLFAIAKRNEIKSLKKPLLAEVKYKISYFLQIKTLQGNLSLQYSSREGNVSAKFFLSKNTAQVHASVFLRLKIDFFMSTVNVESRETYSIHYTHVSRMRPEAIVD